VNARDASDLRRASFRLALRFAAMIVVLFAFLIAVTFVIVGAGQSEATTRALANASRVDSPKDAPAGVLVAMRSGATLLVSADAPSWFPELRSMSALDAAHPATQVTREVAGRTFVIRTSVVDGRVVQAAMDIRENAEELQRLTLGLIVSGVLVALASAVVGAVMARQVMRPMVDALALQRRFVTDASHELRTPLTLLSTRAQLLRRTLPAVGPEDEANPVAAGLEEMIQDSRDLTGILEDLLIAADPRETVEMTPLDLAELARKAVSSLRAEAAARGVELATIGSGLPVIVDGAEMSLRRLFTALIANALDHARTSVTVEVRIRGRTAAIRVGDDGPGFAPGTESRAFDRFVSSRPDADENTRGRHYGLGLALVAEVAARHHGAVDIESGGSGSGAMIVVRLPLRRS
jgi:two-component system OmpR family sensor kinase